MLGKDPGLVKRLGPPLSAQSKTDIRNGASILQSSKTRPKVNAVAVGGRRKTGRILPMGRALEPKRGVPMNTPQRVETLWRRR